MKEDTLKKRYFYKVSGNLLSIPISILCQGIIPRGLGPKSYGDFTFLFNFFNQIINFFDMGTSAAFYTKLSQRPERNRLVVFYSYFIATVGLLIAIFIAISQFSGACFKIWPNQAILFIYLAFVLSMLTWINQIVNQMIDAYGLTVKAEIGRFFQKLFGLCIIWALFIFQKINIFNYFIYNYFLIVMLMTVFFVIMRKNGLLSGINWKIGSVRARKFIIEFYEYSHPLFFYGVLSLIVNIFDRWILQLFGGSVKQGFFSFSYQVGAICFLAAAAMTSLITREFSIAHSKKNIKEMAELFRKYVPLLAAVTAFIACFTAVNADSVTLILGGGKFKDATAAVCIMSIYPVYQSYGQLTSSVFYSTGQTKLYRNIASVFLLAGIPLTYFMIAPKNLLGLDAGAFGLAIKMIILDMMSVNVLLYFSVKFLRLNFLKFFGHQLGIIAFFTICAVLIKFTIIKIINIPFSVVGGFLFSGVLYCMLAGLIVWKNPIIFGLRQHDFNRIFIFTRSKLK